MENTSMNRDTIDNPLDGKKIFAYHAAGKCSITLPGTRKCLYIDFDQGTAHIGPPLRVNNK